MRAILCDSFAGRHQLLQNTSQGCRVGVQQTGRLAASDICGGILGRSAHAMALV